MLRASLATLLAVLVVLPSLAADSVDASDLLALLKDRGAVRVRFVEERRLELLKHPLVTEGTLAFDPPDYLLRQDLLPDTALYEVRGEVVTVRRGGAVETFSLADQPLLAAMILPFRATFAGDLAALETAYAVSVEGTVEGWLLRLDPKSAQVARLIERIEVEGVANHVSSVRIEERDGDLTLMRITDEAA